MTNLRTNFENAYSTTLSAPLGSVATVMAVAVAPTVAAPFYLVLEPTSATKREYVKVTGVAGLNLTVERYLTGSAALSGIAHDAGVEVTLAPTSQAFIDLHDRVSGHTHAGTGDTGATVSHDVLTGVSVNDHHAQSHIHDGADGSGTVAHSATTGRTANDHHAQSHIHDGADGSGTVAHAAVTGKTANDHHNQLHAEAHHSAGADPLIVMDTVTTDNGNVAMTTTATNRASVTFTKPSGWTSYDLIAWGHATMVYSGADVDVTVGALCRIGTNDGTEIFPYWGIDETVESQPFGAGVSHKVTAATDASLTVAVRTRELVATGAIAVGATVTYMAVRRS